MSKLLIQWSTEDGDVLASAEVEVSTELSAIPRISGSDQNELERMQNGAANTVAAMARVAARTAGPEHVTRTPPNGSPVYEVPDWSLIGTHQTIRCGKSGIRYEQDTRHAGWIRREARKRGLKASVSLGSGGHAHVRLLHRKPGEK